MKLLMATAAMWVQLGILFESVPSSLDLFSGCSSLLSWIHPPLPWCLSTRASSSSFSSYTHWSFHGRKPPQTTTLSSIRDTNYLVESSRLMVIMTTSISCDALLTLEWTFTNSASSSHSVSPSFSSQSASCIVTESSDWNITRTSSCGYYNWTYSKSRRSCQITWNQSNLLSMRLSSNRWD